ncbi:hypothetical protein DL764_006800 [Monosporascus ibericus]|uniref:Major facilitator superfamily (MFS) profile domain-containing protein n=1 Tax=Monosporascus ibericus TaxID=155417 RepID=A0A4Q4T735_9PEZI|nr:hypothetical protein DL764_006800 [Monosporascus ibericus]
MPESGISAASRGQSPGHRGRRDGDERTPLLGESRDFEAVESRPAPINISGLGDGSDLEALDPNESDLLLARSVSSTPSGLAPEALESAMLRNRSRSGGSRCRPSWVHEHGERQTLDSAIAEEAEADSDSEGPFTSRRHDAEAGTVAATKSQNTQREFLVDTDNRRFWAVFVGVMATYFIACFDGTIMASSHPVITSYFRSSNSASWLSTAFLLTNTAFQPMVGRLSDSVGRKPPYLVTVTVFAVATLWCALARSMTSFIIARALCGLGAGGMMALGNIIISDLVPIERRGAYQSYINIVYGIATTAGAALGGLMADRLGWRWEFGIQVPPLVLMLFVTAWVIPADLGLYEKRETLMEAVKAFDFAGSLLLTTSITFLILGLNLGGNVLPSSLIASGVCFPVYLWVESRATRPILPLELLHSSPRANIIFSNFLASFLMNAILFNAPLFFQAVLLTSATESGLYLVVPTAMTSTCGTLTGFLITWTRRLKWPLTLGTSLYVLGTAALASIQRGWSTPSYLLLLIPSSMAQGFQFPGTFVALLASSTQREQAVVTSALMLWRALGSVLGVAASSLVLQNALFHYLSLYVVADGVNGRDEAWKRALIARVRESVEAVARLADEGVREQVVLSYQAAVRVTFLCCVAVALVSAALIAPIRLPRLGDRK